jgi:flagellar motility protein MotE (MotC chaperone)
MKTPRLLPVVIAAATALLLFKGIGLVTTGGYVLTGASSAVAAGGGSGGHAAPAKGAPAGADPTMALPPDTTMADTSPTLDDGAPVLPLEPDGAAEAGGGHGAAAPAAEGQHGAESAGEHAAEPAAEESGAAPIDVACAPTAPAAASEAAGHGAAPAAEAQAAEAEPLADCPPTVNEHGDALPMELNSAGVLAPMEGEGGSEAELLDRLGERRDSLDAREKELEMRMALVEAAEKRLDERTETLKAIEAKINALVDEKKASENEQFASIVAMYETMKPKEAATIFNQLDMGVLMRVAKAMNPRKMAPVLAKMDPLKAKSLTAGLATEQPEPALDTPVEDLASLPQIVGQ